jgi:hypothetical protein
VSLFVSSTVEDFSVSASDKPEQGKQYVLVGGAGVPSIAAGNSWAESEVKKEESEEQ